MSIFELIVGLNELNAVSIWIVSSAGALIPPLAINFWNRDEERKQKIVDSISELEDKINPQKREYEDPVAELIEIAQENVDDNNYGFSEEIVTVAEEVYHWCERYEKAKTEVREFEEKSRYSFTEKTDTEETIDQEFTVMAETIQDQITISLGVGGVREILDSGILWEKLENIDKLLDKLLAFEETFADLEQRRSDLSDDISQLQEETVYNHGYVGERLGEANTIITELEEGSATEEKRTIEENIAYIEHRLNEAEETYEEAKNRGSSPEDTPDAPSTAAGTRTEPDTDSRDDGASSLGEDVLSTVNKTLDQADGLRQRARDLREAGAYDRAVKRYEEARETYAEALDMAAETAPIDTDEIVKKRDAVVEERRETRRTQLEERIESLREDLGRAETLVDGNEWANARERLTEIESRISSARTAATEQEFDDPQDALAILDQRRAGLIETVRSKRREELTSETETIRSALTRAEALAEQGALGDARERLKALAERLTEAEESALRHELTDLESEIATLEARRTERLDAVIEQLKTGPTPEEIPTVPDISVEYDALTNREPIGTGGNADVTKATVPTPEGGVTIAIKEPRMSGTLHTDAVEQMLEEAKTWDKLDGHDHIVSVVDYASAPVPWIAMEYMDGGHLGTRTAEMSLEQALWTAIGITKAVRHAHRRGVAHLDLKPANVLLRQTGDQSWDVPKVADWGLSKHLLEHSKSVEGLSPQYAAPEQFDDSYGPADDLTDVYQLGAVLYDLFTGQPPFSGTPADVMRRILTEQPTPPSEIADVPEKLDEMLLTAMAKKKDDRYESVVYIRDTLEEMYDRVHSGKGIDSHHPTNMEGPSGQADLNTHDSTATEPSVVGVCPQKASQWPMFEGGTTRIGYHPRATGPQQAIRLTEQWAFETDDYVNSSPAVADGTVYVGSCDDNVYAIDADDGSKQWVFQTGNWVASSPAVVDDSIYVGSWDNNVYAIDADDGTEQWSFRTGEEVVSSPAVVDGTVYVGSGDDNVYAIDADDGTERWAFRTGPVGDSSPAVSDGTVYVGSYDDNVYAIDASDGTERWTFQTGDDVHSSPAVADGTVYVGSQDNNVYAIDASDGSQQWAFQTRPGVVSSPAIADGTVYLGSRDDNVYAIDASDGSRRWAFQTDDEVDSSPAVVDSTVYIGSDDGNVYALTRR